MLVAIFVLGLIAMAIIFIMGLYNAFTDPDPKGVFRVKSYNPQEWKKGLIEFFNQHPNAKKIYDKLFEYRFRLIDDESKKTLIDAEHSLFKKGKVAERALLNDLFAMGAKAIISNYDGIFVFSKEMIFVYCRGLTPVIYPAPNKEQFMGRIHKEARTHISGYSATVPAKQKSVIGSAIAGGVVAGGVGAVVGAVAAASHNNTAQPKTKTFYSVQKTGKYKTYYQFDSDGTRMCFDVFENRPDLNMKFYVADGITLDGDGIDIVISNLIDQIWK